MKKIGLSILMLLLFSMSPLTFAYTHHQVTASGQSKTNANDANVIGFIETADMNEVAAGKLAEKKSTNVDIKKFGRHMLMDHSKNLVDAKKVSKQIKTPANKSNEDVVSLTKEGQSLLASLNSKEGKDFDQTYVNAMVTGHQAVLDKIDSFLKEDLNPTLNVFTQKTRTIVRHHLEMAKEMQAKQVS